jgi:two-component sensor histidine kinase
MWIFDKIAILTRWGLNYWAAIVTGLILLLISALLAFAISEARQHVIAQATLKASYLAAGLEEDAVASLQSLALASEFIKRSIETEGDVPSLAELKAEISTYVPGLTTISVIGPDGNLRATSGDVASAPVNFSNFDFFLINRDSLSAGFRLDQPITGLLSNRAIIPATQRLQKKDGEFAGIVLLSLDPERMTAMYRRVDLGNSGSLLLIGTGGIVFFGYTLPRGLDPSMIGTSAANENALALMQSGSSGSYIATSSFDGIERVYSWRRLANFPVIALVGLGKAEALAPANRQAMRMLVLGALPAGFLLALTIMLSREISRRIKQTQALEETNAKLMTARVDIAERERHEEHIKLLMSEVNHRSRNMLAVVQAIARQTVATNLDDFVERFVARIQALAASQDLLVESEWKGVDLHQLARSQLGHLEDLVGNRIELRGPSLLVSASAAQTLSMALHELATNAAKYGALSNDRGRVEVSWSLEPEESSGEAFVII